MTIAACFVSADGIVFGADSTTTMHVADRTTQPAHALHHYNFAQKIFEIGENSSLGLVMWGLGNLKTTSYRTLIAQFAAVAKPCHQLSVQAVAQSWADFFWSEYSATFAVERTEARRLAVNMQRTAEEDAKLQELEQFLSGGFCLGGCLSHDHVPEAYEILYSPSDEAPRTPEKLQTGTTRFWGCPNIVQRVLFGADESFFQAILDSGKWSGSPGELFELLRPHCLGQPLDLPIREAVDWVHASIYTTIKTMKFSHLAPYCGGPVEVSVITSDRPFRWVRHKALDQAIGDGGGSHD
jgi:hypothetical protein